MTPSTSTLSRRARCYICSRPSASHVTGTCPSCEALIRDSETPTDPDPEIARFERGIDVLRRLLVIDSVGVRDPEKRIEVIRRFRRDDTDAWCQVTVDLRRKRSESPAKWVVVRADVEGGGALSAREIERIEGMVS